MSTEQNVDDKSVFLLQRLMESCEDDAALAREVLEDFQQSAPNRLSRLAAAVVAVDPVLVQFEAHSLKGISSTIGAESLAAVSAQLEIEAEGGNLSAAPILICEAQQRLHRLSDVLTAYLADD